MPMDALSTMGDSSMIACKRPPPGLLDRRHSIRAFDFDMIAGGVCQVRGEGEKGHRASSVRGISAGC